MQHRAYTALVVVVVRPQRATDAQRFASLQKIRRAHDAAYERWLPHLTLIPPFQLHGPPCNAALPAWLATDLDAVADTAQTVCDGTKRHTIKLQEIHSFPLRKYENIHLRPDRASAAPLAAFQKTLQQALHHCIRDKSKQRMRFVPHASLGQAYTPRDAETIVEKAVRTLQVKPPRRMPQPEAPVQGIWADVATIQVMYKPVGAQGSYTVWRTLPLQPT
ncbi:hypothetical protein MVES1_002283 [Malassezia vespertilionis]|uniref:uncharacterized protein n=1 Tax=Malassezia vespertilionis TaxID=2020962 RepID=UPI0024B265D0|nr:uncharacterized protein MVES1_002283 [Malassezia vespertilionis]WFD06928.1 hypothetical protein MVES1_002283 [Malassezia vespertilionis]